MTNEIKLITIKQACEMTSLSRTAINKSRAAGRFPKAVNIDGRRIAFVRDEVQQFIVARVNSRNVEARS